MIRHGMVWHGMGPLYGVMGTPHSYHHAPFRGNIPKRAIALGPFTSCFKGPAVLGDAFWLGFRPRLAGSRTPL